MIREAGGPCITRGPLRLKQKEGTRHFFAGAAFFVSAFFATSFTSIVVAFMAYSHNRFVPEHLTGVNGILCKEYQRISGELGSVKAIQWEALSYLEKNAAQTMA
jgi:hypothetical protein